MTASALSSPIPDMFVAEARRRVLDAVIPVPESETLGLADALGRVLAADVIAPFDVPAHDNSAMDGYAVRSADLSSGGPTRLRVIGTAFAGRPFDGATGAGEAVRIMTGAKIPAGADAVVVQEVALRDGDAVTVPPGLRVGANLRRAGEDLAAGRAALPAGRRIGAAELGLVASLGLTEVVVRRRVRIALLSTGDELALPGGPRADGQIFDSNRHSLAGLLRRPAFELVDHGIVRDEPQALEAAFRRAALDADAVVTSGGVSAGDADFVRGLMEALGEVSFWKLAMKPGRPFAFGRIGEARFFGLPGNPVAAMVACHQFVLEALDTMAGISPLPARPLLPVRCAAPIRKKPGRREFLRGRLVEQDGAWSVAPFGHQGSGVLRSMSEADCFIVLGEAQGDVAAGDLVGIQLFEGLNQA